MPRDIPKTVQKLLHSPQGWQSVLRTTCYVIRDRPHLASTGLPAFYYRVHRAATSESDALCQRTAQNNMMKAFATAAVCLALCLVDSASAALLLSRPNGDCLSPAISTLNYNIYPASYQLKSIQTSAFSGFETTVDFAEDFSVTYKGTYKVVVNKRANETYVLYQCGTPNPLQTANTETNLPVNTKVFQIPLVSVAVTDSNAAGFLAELSLLDRVAFASQYSYDACLQAINACDDSVSPDAPLDYDPTPANDAQYNTTLAQWKNQTALQDPQVDAVFSFGASKNPKSIAISAFADPGVLNRAEWVKFVAVFFNKEVEAEKMFTQISADYQKLNTTTRAAAAKVLPRPTVAWISKSGNTISVAYANYKKQFLEDAGGVLPNTATLLARGATPKTGQYSTVDYNFNSSVPAQMQNFTAILQEVDIIFDDSYGFGTGNQKDLAGWQQLYGFSSATAASIPAFAGNKVYSFNNRLSGENADGDVGSDWFESAVARPDLVLVDFVEVITPSALSTNAGTPTWLRKLPASVAKLTANTPASCTSIKIDQCERAQPARICPNAYRDCATGELKTVEDPTQRCQVQTICPAAQTATNTTAASTPAPPKSSALTAMASMSHVVVSVLVMVLLAVMW